MLWEAQFSIINLTMKKLPKQDDRPKQLSHLNKYNFFLSSRHNCMPHLRFWKLFVFIVLKVIACVEVFWQISFALLGSLTLTGHCWAQLYLGKIRLKSNPINLSNIILFLINFVYIVMGIALLEPSVPTI
jgi:hypothetical protein